MFSPESGHGFQKFAHASCAIVYQNPSSRNPGSTTDYYSGAPYGACSVKLYSCFTVQACVPVSYCSLNCSTAANTCLSFSDSTERKTLHVALHHHESYRVLYVWFCQVDPHVELHTKRTWLLICSYSIMSHYFA